VVVGAVSGCGAPEGTFERRAPVKVALDARLTRQMSVGMKAYAAELTARLPRVAPDLNFTLFDKGGNFGWDEEVRLPAAIRREKPDLTHYLSLYTPLFAPRPYVVTIHDLIHLRFPEFFKARVRPYYRIHVRFVCSRARYVITDDERTIADLQRFLGIDPERVRVVPLGVDDVFLQPHEPFRPPRPYVLYAGNHRAHKDLPTLFAAWSGLPAEIPLDVYVTGDDDFGELSTRYVRENGRIVALGDVSSEDLAAYYAGAKALVHPALCEGFGLPMLEAMASGCPVIACQDAVPGVLRSAALTFAPRDASGARAALQRLLGDEGLRGALVNQGQTVARSLTWDRCAMRTAEIYREALEER
jgi:glycosyltransferase involved in cell wall biosynthesis